MDNIEQRIRDLEDRVRQLENVRPIPYTPWRYDPTPNDWPKPEPIPYGALSSCPICGRRVGSMEAHPCSMGRGL